MTTEPPRKIQERQVARKLWISEITAGELIIAEGLQPNLLRTPRGDVGRVNIVGIVISVEELPVSSISIDDGTGAVIIRSFDVPLHASVGDFVQVIGRPRTYQREMYIAAEAVAKVSSGWAAFRKAEIGEPAAPLAQKEEVAPVETTSESNAERIIKLIIELDRGDGAPVEEVIFRSKIKDAERIIEQLLLAGDIFELRPGKVKVL